MRVVIVTPRANFRVGRAGAGKREKEGVVRSPGGGVARERAAGCPLGAGERLPLLRRRGHVQTPHSNGSNSRERSQGHVQAMSRTQRKLLHSPPAPLATAEGGHGTTFSYLSRRGFLRDPRPPRGWEKTGLGQTLSRRLPSLLREKPLDIGRTDKVFASQWITEEDVVVGTKCNKVRVCVRVPCIVRSVRACMNTF